MEALYTNRLWHAHLARIHGRDARATSYFRFSTFAVNDPLTDALPAVRSISPEIESAETEVTFTSPVKALRSSQFLVSVPLLRVTRPTVSTFMYLSALAE